MTDKDKTHNIAVAYDLIRKVHADTDEELWACEYLERAIAALNMYFEETEI